jgi:hypothetical protein
MRIYTCHDPSTDTDYLITLHADGSGEFATRPGRDQRWLTWSAPVELRAEAS